jgi:hypothetical protein
MRRGLVTGCVLSAACLLMAGSAAARGWRLSVKPSVVTRGGTLRIRTTSGARTCRLAFRIAGITYRYRIRGRGSDFTMARNSDLGRARVTVRCKGVVRSKTFRIVRAATQHVTPPPTPPSGNSPPAASGPQRTPVTVYNVCHFDPRLGTPRYVTLNSGGLAEPTAVWYDSSGRITFFAMSIDGDSFVDEAVVPTADNSAVAYFARCTWPDWVNVATWQQEHTGVTAAEAGSQAFLESVMPIDLSAPEIASAWVQEDAGWQQCHDPSEFGPDALCEYEPAPS